MITSGNNQAELRSVGLPYPKNKEKPMQPQWKGHCGRIPQSCIGLIHPPNFHMHEILVSCHAGILNVWLLIIILFLNPLQVPIEPLHKEQVCSFFQPVLYKPSKTIPTIDPHLVTFCGDTRLEEKSKSPVVKHKLLGWTHGSDRN